MERPADRPPPPARLLASPRVRMRLIAVSAAILIVGSALAPREDAVPSRTEGRANPLIEEQVAAAAPAATPFSGVQDAARLPRAHVVEIHPARATGLDGVAFDLGTPPPIRLEGAGVVVSEDYVLTHATALDGRLAVRIVTADGRSDDAVLAAHDPATGLVLLRSRPGLAPPAVIASAPPVAGALAVAVGHIGRRPIALPASVATVSDLGVVVTADGPATAPGLPVFTLEGTLVGVMGVPGSGDVALAHRAVDRLIARAAAGEVPRSLGLTVQRVDGALARAFGTRGVLVSDVVQAGPAAKAGVVAGDVLVGVGETDVTSWEGARDALATSAAAPSATVRLVREGREIAVAVTAVSSYTLAHLALVEARGERAPLAGAVLSPPLLTTLALASEARVLSINGVGVGTLAQANRALALRRPVDVLRVRDVRGTYFVATERPR